MPIRKIYPLMKTSYLPVPVAMSASLASLLALNLSCGKQTLTPPNHLEIPAAGTNAAAPAASAIITNATTNSVTTTNPSTVTVAPATPEIAPTAPASPSATALTKSNAKVVEMPDGIQSAPKSFYPDNYSTNRAALFNNQSDYYFTARAGYEHTGYGNSRDTWYAAIKFYAHPEKLRARAGKLQWLVPDAALEFSHQALARPAKATNPGAGDGLQLRTDFYWSWLNWTTRVFARENCACAYAQPMNFSLGPVFTTGFDKTFEGSAFRASRYVGARLSLNRYAFVQYSFGKTDGLGQIRQELLGELPFYLSRNHEVRYVLRGEWSRGDQALPDYYQIGVFAEMPLDLLVRPRQWRELVPFLD